MALKLMTKISFFLIMMLWIINLIDCSILSSQKLDLRDTRTFVISTDDEDYDADESEMIKPKDIDLIEFLVKDKEKYTPLHSYVVRYNQMISPATSIPLRDLSALMQNVFHIRTLQSIFDFEQPKRKSFKKENDEYNDDYEKKEKDTYITTAKQKGVFFDSIDQINQTILETETLTTESTKSTELFFYESENTEDFEITPTHSIHKVSYTSNELALNMENKTESEIGTSENLIVFDTSSPLSTTMNRYDKEITTIIQTTQRSTTDLNEKIRNLSDKNLHSQNHLKTTMYTNDVITRLSTEEKFYSNTTDTDTASDDESKTTTTANSFQTTTEESTMISSNHFTENYSVTSHITTKESTKISNGESVKNVSTYMSFNTETEPFEFTTKKNEQNHSREYSTQNTTIKSTITSIQSTSTEETENLMEYDRIFPEYSSEIEELKADNFTYNFTDDEIERTLKNLAKKTFDFKKPRNCSAFQGLKYGIQAIECAISDFQHAKNRTEAKKVFIKIWKIVKVWLYIYAAVAIPCWCQKGWCCCCFCCKFCFPRKTIMIEKKYFSENPTGILIDTTIKDKQNTAAQTIKYEPTIFEQDAYEQFESAIRNL